MEIGSKQTFQSSTKANWFSLGILFWRLTISEDGIIQFKRIFKQFQTNLTELKTFKIINFGIGCLLILKANGKFLFVVGEYTEFSKIDQAFKEGFQNLFNKDLVRFEYCHSLFKSILFGELYIRSFIANKLKSELFGGDSFSLFNVLSNLRSCLFFEKEISPEIKTKVVELITWGSRLDYLISEFNKVHIPKAKEEAGKLSEELTGRRLTDQQIDSVVMFEDNNLLVASAGSGKSATLVNKACYAIEKGYVKPNEILVLAFGKKAADELDEKFEEIKKKRPGFIAPTAVSTFHSIGANIIRQCTGNLFLSETALSAEKFTGEIKSIVTELQSDSEFVWKFAMLCSLFGKQNIFNSKQQDYFQKIFSKVQDAWELKSEVKEKVYFLKTLKGENVRSLEELIIANWYLMYNIEYTYEKETQYQNYKGKVGIHRPDFYLNQYDIYHEHYALDKNEQAPKEYGPDYLQRVVWKRNWYTEQKKSYFESTSAMFRSGDVFKNIENELLKRKVSITLRSRAELEALYDKFAFESVIGLIGSAIKHIRNQGRASNDLFLDFKYPDVTYSIFYEVVVSILSRYEKGLAARSQIDFEDMLLQSAKFIENNTYKSNFKLILVDEFQDISKARFKLLQAFLRQNPESILFAVGDDWQGIYKFAGADLDLFVNFSKHFGVTSEMQLTKTFRSNQGIADLASGFIQKNPIQKHKKISSTMPEFKQVVEIIKHSKNAKKKELLANLIEELISSNKNKKLKIFVLGRYNFTLNPAYKSLVRTFQKSADIEFMTFHKAKGLEADCAILLDVNSSDMPFPSIKEDHPLLKIFVDNNDDFRHSEERRLFYVALTRARHKVLVLCIEESPSVFVEEILNDKANGDTTIVRIAS